MRNIRVYFDSFNTSVAYEIDLIRKRFKVGKVLDGVWVDTVQDEPYKDPVALQRQIATILAIELNRVVPAMQIPNEEHSALEEELNALGDAHMDTEDPIT